MCRIFACRNGAAEEMPSLWQGLACACLSLAQKKRAVVAFTGSGGKTTWIYRLAEELRRQGKRVAIATTTHMYEPPPELLADDTETVKSLLEGRGFAVVGRRDGRGKIGCGGDALFSLCRVLADVVLIEADGSRRQPLKCFGLHEPVIPPDADCTRFVSAGNEADGSGGRSLRTTCSPPSSVRVWQPCAETGRYRLYLFSIRPMVKRSGCGGRICCATWTSP